MDAPITATPTKASDIRGGKLVIASDYEIEIDTSLGYLALVVGFDHDKAGAKFSHSNLLDRAKRVHEYKHYRDNGSKFWTSRAGVDLMFAVPLDKITILPEKGLSYVKTEIGGEKIVLNVSGGCGNGLWTDWVRSTAHTNTNMPMKMLKAIASASMAPGEIQGQRPGFEHNDNTEREEASHDRMVAEAKWRSKAIELVDAGTPITVALADGLKWQDMTQFLVKKVERRWGYPEGRKQPAKGFIYEGFCNLRIKLNQIDWIETASLNRWSPAPAISTEYAPEYAHPESFSA